MMTRFRAIRRSQPGWVVILLLVMGFSYAVAAETVRLESAWSVQAPTIDGRLTEWDAPLVSLGAAPLSIGVRNDSQFLYVALVASDPATRMLLGQAGFTVWWDPAAKEKKSYGITIPPLMARGPGMRGGGRFGEPPDQGGPPPSQGQGGQSVPPAQGQEGQSVPPAQGQEGQPRSGAAGPPIEAIGHIEVIGPAKEDRRRLELAFARTAGLDAAARMAEGVLVYEIRVPLAASEGEPYAVRSTPGATFGLGIETNEMPRFGGRGEEGGGGRPGGGGGRPPGGGGGGMGGGGMMGGGGGHGGMGGGHSGGGREGMRSLKPIKTWTVVHLVTPPA